MEYLWEMLVTSMHQSAVARMRGHIAHFMTLLSRQVPDHVRVSCSMGGILVKEMLVKAMQPGAPALHAQLRRQTRGLAFYATPHHGSWLADVGWNLRFLGASPAASVVHLKRGPQQEVLALSPLCRRDNLLQDAVPAADRSSFGGVSQHIIWSCAPAQPNLASSPLHLYQRHHRVRSQDLVWCEIWLHRQF